MILWVLGIGRLDFDVAALAGGLHACDGRAPVFADAFDESAEQFVDFLFDDALFLEAVEFVYFLALVEDIDVWELVHAFGFAQVFEFLAVDLVDCDVFLIVLLYEFEEFGELFAVGVAVDVVLDEVEGFAAVFGFFEGCGGDLRELGFFGHFLSLVFARVEDGHGGSGGEQGEGEQTANDGGFALWVHAVLLLSCVEYQSDLQKSMNRRWIPYFAEHQECVDREMLRFGKRCGWWVNRG